MSYSKIEGVYLNAILVASTSVNQAQLAVRDQSSGALFIKWSGAAATDAVVKFQESPVGGTDDDDWVDVTGLTQTLNAAKGLKKLAIADVNMPYLRAVVTKNSETTAVLTVRHYFKGAR